MEPINRSGFACPLCDKELTAHKNVQRHLREVHNIEPNKNCTIKCPECTEQLCSHISLIKHLKGSHNKLIDEECLLFKSIDEFNVWKKNEESKLNAMYVKHRGDKRTNGGTVISIYYCHREGLYRDKAGVSRKKLMKSSGSNKIGTVCPSFMKVEQSQSEIKVQFFSTHMGHKQQLGRLLLTEEERLQIAGLISSGVSFSKIIEKIRSSATAGVDRIHLVTRKDLQNIKNSYFLFDERMHVDEVASTTLLIESLRKLEDNPIMYYKPQQEVDVRHLLSEDDFCIIIMTDFQKGMLENLGSDKICIDGTHDTNKHKFYLHSILVVDEFSSGCPVAFCLSNRKDQVLVEIFLKVLVEKLGHPIKTAVFMSDDDQTYYNAWEKVMGPPEKRLLCIWHVQRNWNLNLKSKIQNAEKRALVFKMLQILLSIGSQPMFEEKLALFLQELESDEELCSFSKYFLEHYAKRSHLWAYCYRIGAGINTNMYIESFHKTLKYIYFEGKRNQRIDTLITILLKISRDKLFERLTKKEKGCKTSRIKDIESSHRKASEILPSMISSIQEQDSWEVMSSEKNKTYLVIRQEAACSGKCNMVCRQCNICVHMYSCTSCIDSMVKLNICKHIHACAKERTELQKEITSFTIPDFIEPMPSTSSASATSVTKKDLLTKAEYLLGCIATSSCSCVDNLVINRKMDKLISLVKECSSLSAVRKSHEPVNKKLEPQPRSGFFSTRKQNFIQKLQKPARHEEENLIEGLGRCETVNIHTAFDHTY